MLSDKLSIPQLLFAVKAKMRALFQRDSFWLRWVFLSLFAGSGRKNGSETNPYKIRPYQIKNLCRFGIEAGASLCYNKAKNTVV